MIIVLYKMRWNRAALGRSGTGVHPEICLPHQHLVNQGLMDASALRTVIGKHFPVKWSLYLDSAKLLPCGLKLSTQLNTC